MLPVLIRTSYFTLYTYGIFVCLALFWSMYFVWKYIRITRFKEEDVFDVLIVAGIVGMICGRTVYVLFQLPFFLARGPISFFAVHIYPGIHELSAILTTICVAYLLLRRKRVHASEVVAHSAVGICMGLAILRLAALFAGTEIGTITTFPLRVQFTGYEGLRHMVGAYEAFTYLIGACIIHRLLLWVRQHKHTYTIVLGVLAWLIGFVHIAFYPLKETALMYKSAPTMRYFDYAFVFLILLTGLGVLMYHLRLYFTKHHAR